MKKMKRKILCGILCAGLIASGTGCSKTDDGSSSDSSEKNSAEEPIVITIGVSISEDQTGYLALERLKEIVEEESGGAMEVEIYGNSVLGGDTDIADAVIQGNVTMGMPTVSSLATYAKELNVLDSPFLFSSTDQVYEVLDSEVGQTLLDSLNAAGLQGLSFWENGFRYLTANKEIHSVDDLKNLKIRVMENEIHLAFWKALGANPSPLSYSELYTALQQGSFDAEENTLSNIQGQKFYEVQSYVIGTKHLYSPYCLYTNQEFWESLSEENRQILTEAIAACRDEQREMCAEEEETILQSLADEGCTYVELTEGELTEFKQGLDEIYAQVVEIAGEEISNEFFAAAEAAK